MQMGLDTMYSCIPFRSDNLVDVAGVEGLRKMPRTLGRGYHGVVKPKVNLLPLEYTHLDRGTVTLDNIEELEYSSIIGQ